MMLKFLSFDVGETLINSHYLDYVWLTAIPKLYAEKKDLSFTEAKDYVLREYDRVGMDDIRWYLPEYWFKYLNLDGDPLKVFRSHMDKIRFYPEVELVLENLSKRYDLIVASGIPKNIIEIIFENFKHHFKHIFSPVSDLKEPKKTKGFYEMICKILEVKPTEVLHVGDDWNTDLILPKVVGIRCIFLDRTGENRGKCVIKDLSELEEHLDSLKRIC